MVLHSFTVFSIVSPAKQPSRPFSTLHSRPFPIQYPHKQSPWGSSPLCFLP
nr:MAG TPA: hypothetical protein [Caudoviricetes sp.]